MAAVSAPAAALGRAERSGVSIAFIRDRVAVRYGLTPTLIQSDRRDKRVVMARQVAMYLARTRSKASYPVIGRCFGNKDHTTVISAVNAVLKLRESDPGFAAEIDAIDRDILIDCEMADAAEPVEAFALALRVVDDPHAVGPLAIAEGEALAAALIETTGRLEDASVRVRSMRAQRDAQERRRRRLEAAVRNFLEKTDAIRDARGEEDRFLARDAQHAAFKTLRLIFEAPEKETGDDD
jgi:hypothetical protein